MTAQPDWLGDDGSPQPALIDPEARVGEALWNAVGDPSWEPSDEFLGYMARAPFEIPSLASLLRRILGLRDSQGSPATRWSAGVEALVAGVVERHEEIVEQLVGAEEIAALVRYCAARHGVLPEASRTDELLQRAVTWFLEVGTGNDPTKPEGWWDGYDTVWPESVWWTAVAAGASDTARRMTTSPRLRPALRFASAAAQPVIAVRLFASSPRWATEALEGLDAASWEPLMDLAEAVVEHGASSEASASLASGVAVGLAVLSKSLDKSLAPAFFARLLGIAIEHNTHAEAIEYLNRALALLPVGPRQRLMLSSPYLRWRYLPACPTQVVIDWAVGEVSKLSPRTFSQLLRDFPEGAFHFGGSIVEMRAIAADALGGAGEAALPFLVDGISRATDANKVVFASALASIRTPEAMGPLLQALANGTPTVRRVICDGLSSFGDDLLPELEPLLRDPRRPLRAAAASVLAGMEPSGDVRDMAARVLSDEDASEIRAVLKGVVDAPARPRELVQIERLEATLSPVARRGVIESLHATDGRAWREHVALGVMIVGFVATWRAQERAADRDRGGPALYDAMLHFVEDPGLPWAVARMVDHPKFQTTWLEEAAEILGRRLAAPLQNRLAGASGERRRMLLRTMSAYCAKACVHEFMRGITSGDSELRRICHGGLREAGEASLPSLRAALAGDDPRLQQQAARVLERLPDPSNVEALRECLSSLHDPRAAWVVQRAIVVSQVDASSEDDRALDRMLRRQTVGLQPPFVVDMALPKVRYKSGQSMSPESRSWFVSALYIAGQKVDWFLPLAHTARLLWAIRSRIDERSAVTFLDELAKQARGARTVEADAFLTIATAVLASEGEIASHIGRIGASDWPGVKATRNRFHFTDGDPRLLFVRGTPSCIRAAMSWSEGSHNPLLTAWSRLFLHKLQDAVGVSRPRLLEVLEVEGQEGHAQLLSRYRDYLRDGTTISFEELLSDAGTGLGASLVRSLVLDSLGDDGSVAARFRWLGAAAEDAEGEPVVVGERVRVSDTSHMHPRELAAWRKIFGETSQPIGQLWPQRGTAGRDDPSKLSTGWLPGPLFCRILARLGYGHEVSPAPIPGGKRRYPSEPLATATRFSRELWTVRLFHTPLTAWDREGTTPEKMRVVGAAFARRDPIEGSPWREVAARDVPPWLRELLSSDLAALDEDAEVVDEVDVGSNETGLAVHGLEGPEDAFDIPDDDDEDDEEEEDEAAATSQEATKPVEPPKPKKKPEGPSPGFFQRWFWSRRRREEEAARRDRERRRAAARERRARAKARAEESKREAVARRDEEKRQESMRLQAQSKRWRAVVHHLTAARQSRNERMTQQEVARRIQRRAALLGAAVGTRDAIPARSFLRHLKAEQVIAPSEGTAPRKPLRPVPVRSVALAEPAAPAVTAASSFIDLSDDVAAEPEHWGDEPSDTSSDGFEISSDFQEALSEREAPAPAPAPVPTPTPETAVEAVREPAPAVPVDPLAERRARIEELKRQARQRSQDARLMAERARRAAEARKAARERLAAQRARLMAARAERAAAARAAETQRETMAASSRQELASAERMIEREARTVMTMLLWQHAAVTAREQELVETARRAEERGVEPPGWRMPVVVDEVPDETPPEPEEVFEDVAPDAPADGLLPEVAPLADDGGFLDLSAFDAASEEVAEEAPIGVSSADLAVDGPDGGTPEADDVSEDASIAEPQVSSDEDEPEHVTEDVDEEAAADAALAAMLGVAQETVPSDDIFFDAFSDDVQAPSAEDVSRVADEVVDLEEEDVAADAEDALAEASDDALVDDASDVDAAADHVDPAETGAAEAAVDSAADEEDPSDEAASFETEDAAEAALPEPMPDPLAPLAEARARAKERSRKARERAEALRASLEKRSRVARRGETDAHVSVAGQTVPAASGNDVDSASSFSGLLDTEDAGGMACETGAPAPVVPLDNPMADRGHPGDAGAAQAAGGVEPTDAGHAPLDSDLGAGWLDDDHTAVAETFADERDDITVVSDFPDDDTQVAPLDLGDDGLTDSLWLASTDDAPTSSEEFGGALATHDEGTWLAEDGPSHVEADARADAAESEVFDPAGEMVSDDPEHTEIEAVTPLAGLGEDDVKAWMRPSDAEGPEDELASTDVVELDAALGRLLDAESDAPPLDELVEGEAAEDDETVVGASWAATEEGSDELTDPGQDELKSYERTQVTDLHELMGMGHGIDERTVPSLDRDGWGDRTEPGGDEPTMQGTSPWDATDAAVHDGHTEGEVTVPGADEVQPSFEDTEPSISQSASLSEDMAEVEVPEASPPSNDDELEPVNRPEPKKGGWLSDLFGFGNKD